MYTLEKHDHLLQERFGLKVQWSHEAGGSVRGVCGAEETTKRAYVPIGLSGKSGVLRVQVVPGDIPFLLPAYFLTELGAVIDMKNATILYTELGVKQLMKRLNTGHVSVSIVEFGDGFCVPANFSGTKEQSVVTKDRARLVNCESSQWSLCKCYGADGVACCCASLDQWRSKHGR